MQLGPPSTFQGVIIKFSFQIVLPTMHRRRVVMDNLGDPLQGSRGCLLGQEKTREHERLWHN